MKKLIINQTKHVAIAFFTGLLEWTLVSLQTLGLIAGAVFVLSQCVFFLDAHHLTLPPTAHLMGWALASGSIHILWYFLKRKKRVSVVKNAHSAK